jgi:hypothetical protein
MRTSECYRFFMQSSCQIHTLFTLPCHNEVSTKRREGQINKKWKIIIPIIAVVLALIAGAGIVAAKSSNTNNGIQAGYYAPADNGNTADQTINQWYCGGSSQMMGYVTPQVASLLGTTTADLTTQINSGKTLSEIANAKGVSNDQLIQTLMGPYLDHMAVNVKYGYLTQAQADIMAQQAQTRLQTVITGKISSSNGFWGNMGDMMKGWFGGTSSSAANSAATGSGMMGGSGRGMMGR